MSSRRNEFITAFAIDAKWFLALKNIKRPLLLQSLGITEESYQKHYREFLQAPNYNPQFEYALGSVQVKEWSNVQQELDKLRTTIIQQEENKSIAAAYRDKIDELQTEIALLHAIYRGDVSEFMRLNRDLYGELKQELVHDVAALLEKNHVTSLSYMRGSERLSLPDTATFLRAKSLFAEWPNLQYSHQGALSAQEIQCVWQAALQSLCLSWRVVISETALHIRVSSKHRQVIIPSHLVASAEKVAHLFAHEVGVHVFRREEGKKSSIQLLSIGLAGYQAAEEGLCLMREQVMVSKMYAYAGFDKYLTLALATGALDGEKRDFKTTFAHLLAYYEERLSRTHQSDTAKRIAQQRAWGNCYRVFRGGDTDTPGCCLLRDKIYREGNIVMWKYLASTTDTSFLSRGKFDPTNADHVAIVRLADRQSGQ